MDTKSPANRKQRQSLESVLDGLHPDGWHDWAWGNYANTILTLSSAFGLADWCEIGGGRDPAFTRDDIERLAVHYTINDISQGELDAAPPGYAKACFDIAGSSDHIASLAGYFDLMFSRMVFEHVKDVAAAWRNVHTLLKPGGVALAFFPTLYAPPFVINRMIPEIVSRAIVHTLYPERRDGGNDPKFPARYDWCFGSGRKLAPMLEQAGFAEHLVLPFWGSDYFRPIPGLRQLDDRFSRLSRARDLRLLTSHAYVVVRK